MSRSPKQSPVFLPAKTREWYKNAVVGWHPDPDRAYADGYHEAAEIVAGRALEGHYPDRLIYPICFLYRHALEVTLKDLIRQVEELICTRAWGEDDLVGHVRTDREIDAELESTHSLEVLLKVFEARLRIVMPEAEIPAEVRAALIELHNRDSNGETFRYGRARGLGKPTFDKQETFDVERIVHRLGEAFRFLSWGAGGALSAEIEAVTDYIAEMERAYG